MPIRHCQKCGLKVLIDESQMGANPFYCQRCAATSESAPAAAPPAEAEAHPPSSTQKSPVAAGPAPLAAVPAKGSALKIACPYCKANFT